MIEASLLQCWLPGGCTASNDGRYLHRLFEEDVAQRELILVEIRAIFEQAHDDAKRHLRSLLVDSLDPLEECIADPTAGYPEQLNIVTLQGYFGEVLSGVVAEVFEHFGEAGWKVPAFLFRFHAHAFDKLELMRQVGDDPGIIPGRSGDDCVAFLRSSEARILASLICEAKCSLNHDANLVAKAHRQVSSSHPKPLSILQFIEVLRDYSDAHSVQWVTSLRDFYLQEPNQEYERCDLVCYVCGRSPVRRASWIPGSQPHDQYSGGRKLEAVEVHLDDVKTVINEIYGID